MTDRAEGTRRLYAIDRAGLAAVREYFDRFWDEALDAFRRVAEGTHAAETAQDKRPQGRTRRRRRDGSPETSVRKSVVVNAPVAHAFTVFTERFDSWWPRTHHIGKVEPFRADRPVRRRCKAGAACEGSAAAEAQCQGACEADCTGMCDGNACQRRHCDGTCEGTCTGQCTLAASAQVNCGAAVDCRGGCSVAYKAPKCETTVTPPSCKVTKTCESSCTSDVEAKAQCTPPGASLECNGTVSADLQAVVDTVKKNMPSIILLVQTQGKLVLDAANQVVTTGKVVAIRSLRLVARPLRAQARPFRSTPTLPRA